LRPFWQPFLGFGRDEGAILHTVGLGVFFGVLHSLAHRFDADHLGGMPGQIKGDGADAAINVGHLFSAGQLGKLQGFFIQHLRLPVIDLKKGLGRNLKAEITDGVLYGLLPGQQAERASQHQFGIAVDVVIHRHYAGML